MKTVLVDILNVLDLLKKRNAPTNASSLTIEAAVVDTIPEVYPRPISLCNPDATVRVVRHHRQKVLVKRGGKQRVLAEKKLVGFKITVGFESNETALEEAFEKKDEEVKELSKQAAGLKEELKKAHAELKKSKLSLNIKGTKRKQGKILKKCT